MAEDLGMWQADISNLEKAKSGSGITDLEKLDRIAEYFNMPLETLLFGRRQDQMEKYQGSKMQLKETTKKKSKKHETLLRKLMGLPCDETAGNALAKIPAFECGPYIIYAPDERQMMLSGGSGNNMVPAYITKPHIYVIYQDEVIGNLTAFSTTIMQHVYQPAFENLKQIILPDIFDLDNTLQVLNPYLPLCQYAADEEEQKVLRDEMYKRMDELRAAGENRTIFYVESAYVREDCRRCGILRLMLDVLRLKSDQPLIWLSLEPTSGDELKSEYSYVAIYQASELGQISLNASIAERLGFAIDPQTENRQVERLEEDGTTVLETVPVRRTAYYLPKKVRNILNGDHDLLAYARARKKALGGDISAPVITDIFQSAWKKQGFIISIQLKYSDGTVYAFARGMDWKSRWLGVSKENPSPNGDFVETLEKYDRLQDAENSNYYLELRVAEQLLGATFFGTVKPNEVSLDDLTFARIIRNGL